MHTGSARPAPAGARAFDSVELWQRYCGFLDLSVSEFMEIQRRLLFDQLNTLTGSALGQRLMHGFKPADLDQFRDALPFTTYEDYAADLREDNGHTLPEPALFWAHTSGRSGTSKKVPYTARGFDRLAEAGITTMMLACSRRRGESRFRPGMRVIYNMPPKPFYTGYVCHALTERVGLRFFPSAAEADVMQFEDKTRASFKLAMKHGVDIVAAQTSVLMKMADSFSQRSKGTRLSALLSQPAMLARAAKGKLISRMAGRNMLPRDLWSVKALICYGMDTQVYKQKLGELWGGTPYEVYGSTEAGGIAFQTWARTGLVFSPFYCFIEFVPDREVSRMLKDKTYQPKSLFLNELKTGERYELFITSFYGMPFLRYRTEDIFEVTALEDSQDGVKLPHFVFVGRIRDIIDISGFAQLMERDFWQALSVSGLACSDWSARKELRNGETVLAIYLELTDGKGEPEATAALHQSLLQLHQDYRDLERMLGVKPLRVSLLPPGTFRRYYEEKKAAGAPLAHLKPPRMNAPDEVIGHLVELGRAPQAG